MQVVHSKNKSYITSNILLQKGRVRAITDISFKVYLIRRNKRWKNQAKTATKYIVWHRAVLYKLCISRILQLKLTFLFLLLLTKGSFDMAFLVQYQIHGWYIFDQCLKNLQTDSFETFCIIVWRSLKAEKSAIGTNKWKEEEIVIASERKILSHPE